jgi:hypothetical protein
MISVYVLSALVLISGEGWVRGENLHPKLRPVEFSTKQECRAERNEALSLYRNNKAYLKKNHGVKRVKISCVRVKKKG